MPKPRRRPMYYSASSLHDGTLIAACPMRRPAPRLLKERGKTIDADGVMEESSRNGKELSDSRNEGRFRFQEVITNRLNTRRAIRELLLKPLADLQSEVAVLQAEVAHLTEVLEQQ